TTQNGSAIAGGNGAIGEDDYDALTGTVTFAPGSTQQLITIAVNGDAINEPTETFTLVLSNQTPGIPLDDTQATGTIGNDDNPPAIAISNASVLEGDLGDTGTA
ncbi:Calx-beta domain-containing protein, partial [Leptolyngbya sp. CCY15150]|uniref:Calx-beta domain-containing protein n=1 Tax=Leptolyngbya sp. CCY15150 TaxID=2767772 RepID=UPI00194DAFF3